MTAVNPVALPGLLLAILVLVAIAAALWPREDAPRPRREPPVEPGIAAWEQDCEERKQSGRWKWGKR